MNVFSFIHFGKFHSLIKTCFRTKSLTWAKMKLEFTGLNSNLRLQQKRYWMKVNKIHHFASVECVLHRRLYQWMFSVSFTIANFIHWTKLVSEQNHQPELKWNVKNLQATYAECHYAKCRYAKCRGAPVLHKNLLFLAIFLQKNWALSNFQVAQTLKPFTAVMNSESCDKLECFSLSVAEYN